MQKTNKLLALNDVLKTLRKKQKQAQMRGEESTSERLNETAQKLESYIKAVKRQPAGKP